MANDITAVLLKGARIDKQGSFTVDAEKARSKMERFRLANPLLYTVELVQAAALAGASEVAIDVDADDFRLSFQPATPIGRAALEDLESAILVRSKKTHPARLQLALATSAAQALNPASITLSADGVTLRVLGERVTLEDSEPSSVVSFALKEQFKLGHFLEFWRGLAGKTEEEQLLRERCSYAGLKVVVNGKQVSGQPWPGPLVVDLVGKGVRGAVGYLPDVTAPSRLILLRGGVTQEELPWADAPGAPPPPGMFAVVHADDLERDASFSRFVRDDAFSARLRTLNRAIEECAAHLERGVLAEEPDALARAANHALWLGKRLFSSASIGAIDIGRHAIRDARLLRDPLDKPLSLARLADVAGGGKTVRVRNDTSAIDTELLEGDVVVQLRGVRDRALLEAVGFNLADVSDDLQRRAETRSYHRAFRERPPAQLTPRSCLRQMTATTKAFTCDVGLRSGGPDELQVDVNHDGCRLATLKCPFPIPGVAIVVSGDFRPNATFDGVIPDAPLADALRRAVGLLPALLDEPFEPSLERTARVRGALMGLLEHAGAPSALSRIVKGALAPNVAEKLESLPAIELTGSKAHALVRAPIIARFPSGDVSIAELSKLAGSIAHVPPGTGTFRPNAPLVIAASAAVLATLRRALPGREFVSLEDQAEQADRMRQLLSRPQSPRTMPDVTDVISVDERITIDGRDVRRVGQIGISASTERGTRLRLMCRGRLVQDQLMSGAIAGLTAVIDYDEVALDPVLRAADLAPYRAFIEKKVPALMQGLASRAASQQDAITGAGAWGLAAQVARIVFPTQEAHACWAALAKRLGDKATDEWLAALSYLERLEPRAQQEALRTILKKGQVATAQALAAVSTPKRAASGQTELIAPHVRGHGGIRAGLLKGLHLRQLSLTRLDRRAVTLTEVIDAGAAVRVTTLDGLAPPNFEDVLLAGECAREVLTCLGVDVVEVDDELSAARARASFEQRALVQATLPSSAVVLRKRAVSEPGLRGEIGLLATPPAAMPQATIWLHHHGRRLATLEVGEAIGVSCVAALEVDDISPNADWNGVVNDRRREAFLDTVRDLVQALVFEHVTQVPVATDDVGRARVLETINSLRSGRAAEAKLAKRLLNQPLYTTVSDAPLALSSVSSSKPLHMLTGPTGTAPPSGYEDAVVIASSSERYVLARIVKTIIVDAAWHAAVDTDRRKAKLAKLPTSIQHAVHVREVVISDAALTLAICADGRPQLIIGADGLHVGTEQWTGPLPIRAIIDGASFVTADWLQPRLSQKQRQTIEREITATWSEALASHERATKKDAASPHNVIASLLRDAALSLGARRVDGLTPDLLALRSRLRRASLFGLSTGGQASLEMLIATRAPQYLQTLVSLGLVEPHREPPPPPPPAAAAAAAPDSVERNDGNLDSLRLDGEYDIAPVVERPPQHVELPGDHEQDETPPAPPRGRRDKTKPPAPAPPPALPADVLLSRLRRELDVLRHAAGVSIVAVDLERIRVEADKKKPLVRTERKGAVVVNVDDPLAQRALTDPHALLLVTLAATCALNALVDRVTDDEERAIVRAAAKHASGMT